MNRCKRVIGTIALIVAMLTGVNVVSASASPAPRQPAAVAKAAHNYVIAYKRCSDSKFFHPSWVQQLSTQREAFQQWRYVGQDRRQIQGWIHTAKLYGRNGVLIDTVRIPCK